MELYMLAKIACSAFNASAYADHFNCSVEELESLEWWSNLNEKGHEAWLAAAKAIVENING